ncbi:hypothetical protein Ancab_034756 [Ancistrocladus abbreviatus]
MRMSCNGCRVLRKGCSDDCSIRPCLQWIRSPESQANATVFLAKFYGRAGLMNLINSGPQHLRPAIFRSLLYEACGRIVNPIYGSVGLLWSGSWQLCQDAVDAVLNGSPITTIASDDATANAPPIKGYDIRHVTKDEKSASELKRVKSRTRFKRTKVVKPKADKAVAPLMILAAESTRMCASGGSASHDSTTSHETADESMVSVETAEAALAAAGAAPEVEVRAAKAGDDEATVEKDGELVLDLMLGFPPATRVCC